MTENKFCGNETYEEWLYNQDPNSLEYKIVVEIHKIYPNWSLEEIKEYAPRFIAVHMKAVQNINKDDVTLNIHEIEKRMLTYVDAGIKGNRVHIEVFGNDESCEDYHYLARWNMQLNRIMKILIHGTKYKSEDSRGHASIHTFRWNGYSYGFRSEMELDRDVKEIVELNRERFGTKSDLFRELIFKGIAIYSIINKGLLGDKAKNILTDIDKFDKREKRMDIQSVLFDIDDTFKINYEDLKDIETDKEALEEFRDEIVKYISDILDRNCSKQDKVKIKNAIMKNRDLSRILDTLEKEKLVSKDYAESILNKGEVIPFMELIQKGDLD